MAEASTSDDKKLGDLVKAANPSSATTTIEQSSPSSSVSSSFKSSGTSSIEKTGNKAFDNDIAEVMDYFDCELETTSHNKDFPLSVLIKLPYYGANSQGRECCCLRVSARPDEKSQPEKYTATYEIAKKAPAMHDLTEADIKSVLDKSLERSRRISKKEEYENPSIICYVDSFYYVLEEHAFPAKKVIIRDFGYSIYDPRHWGRPLPSLINRFGLSYETCGHGYGARAKADFTASTNGELSITKGEELDVLAEFGNDWATARKSATNTNKSNEKDSNDNNNGDEPWPSATGLVPIKYLERMPEKDDEWQNASAFFRFL